MFCMDQVKRILDLQISNSSNLFRILSANWFFDGTQSSERLRRGSLPKWPVTLILGLLTWRMLPSRKERNTHAGMFRTHITSGRLPSREEEYEIFKTWVWRKVFWSRSLGLWKQWKESEMRIDVYRRHGFLNAQWKEYKKRKLRVSSSSVHLKYDWFILMKIWNFKYSWIESRNEYEFVGLL